MTQASKQLLSVVVPVYNERAGLVSFHESLLDVLRQLPMEFEIIYCDDGSLDGSIGLLHELSEKQPQLRVLRLSRNFGKELATTAGIHEAKGDAVVTLDADGQHPVELIPQFVAKWQQGAKVVVGVRTEKRRAGLLKRAGSKFFWGTFSKLSGLKIVPGSSDYRLIDRAVQKEFVRMTERNRITRGLIDWLGYKREYVYYRENSRVHGAATYSLPKLIKLAVDSAISLSISPLYITAYIGAVVLPLSVLLGVGMSINALLGDPMNLHATGGAYLMVFVLFLVGIILVSQGIIGLYLSHIHTETQNRPLYVVDRAESRGVSWGE
ncbi:glycosyltransferase [Candidatus Saccharibacteria bacterium]|nr:MAG: glycosyltransferase [Candidatus Saccharibacteria bacterium]